MRRAVAALILTSLLWGCSRGGETIREVLEKREKALATADAVLYASIISPSYRDKGMDASTKRDDLARTLALFGPIAYRSTGRTIRIDGETATVTGRYVMKVRGSGKPLELAGEETIRLRREGKGWKITGGI